MGLFQKSQVQQLMAEAVPYAVDSKERDDVRSGNLGLVETGTGGEGAGKIRKDGNWLKYERAKLYMENAGWSRGHINRNVEKGS